MEFSLSFGVLSPLINKQLEKQGFTLIDAEMFQRDADSINRLRMRRLLPRVEMEKARKRLIKQITRRIKPAKDGDDEKSTPTP